MFVDALNHQLEDRVLSDIDVNSTAQKVVDDVFVLKEAPVENSTGSRESGLFANLFNRMTLRMTKVINPEALKGLQNAKGKPRDVADTESEVSEEA